MATAKKGSCGGKPRVGKKGDIKTKKGKATGKDGCGRTKKR